MKKRSPETNVGQPTIEPSFPDRSSLAVYCLIGIQKANGAVVYHTGGDALRRLSLLEIAKRILLDEMAPSFSHTEEKSN